MLSGIPQIRVRGTGTTSEFRINSAFGNAALSAIGTVDAAPMMLYTNNTERMRITSAGLVGIATATPYSALSVYGASPASGQNTLLTLANGYNVSGANEPAIRFDNNFSGSYAGWTIGAQVAGSSYFRICQLSGATPTLSEALRIDLSLIHI